MWCILFSTATQLALSSSAGDGAFCPNQANGTAIFTCSVINGRHLRWTVDPPPGYVVSEPVTQLIFSTTVTTVPTGIEGFMFQSAVTDTTNGTLTSTLTTITEVSLLNGGLVTCSSSGIMESQTITILVAGGKKLDQLHK